MSANAGPCPANLWRRGSAPRRRPAASTKAHGTRPSQGGPRGRGPAGRTLAALALAAAAALAVSGCSKFNQALGQQEEVVIFQPNVSNAVKMKVRAACSHVPNVKVEPLPTDHKLSDTVYNVRYEVGSASSVEIARLTQCLSKYPSSIIQGVQTDTPGGND